MDRDEELNVKREFIRDVLRSAPVEKINEMMRICAQVRKPDVKAAPVPKPTSPTARHREDCLIAERFGEVIHQ